MRKYFFIVVSILASSCSNSYNTPFIDYQETKKLKFGMAKETVLKEIGKPLFVSAGDDNEVSWVYEVRAVQVKSNMHTPDKYNDNQVPGEPIHRLELTFKDNKLIKWNEYQEPK